jgi:hypothetical protein
MAGVTRRLLSKLPTIIDPTCIPSDSCRPAGANLVSLCDIGSSSKLNQQQSP